MDVISARTMRAPIFPPLPSEACIGQEEEEEEEAGEDGKETTLFYAHTV
jgi:hypothetical protein